MAERIEGESYFDEERQSIEDLLNEDDRELTLQEKIERDIKRAGSNLKINEYYSLVAISVFSIFTFALITFHGRIFLSATVSFIGLIVPHLYLKRQYQKRLKKFNSQLVDTLRTISSSLRGGLSIEQAIENIAENAPSPTREEFQQVVNDLELGRSLDESLQALKDRINDKDMDLIITVIFIQRQIGGNLTEILDNIAETIEDRIKLKQEIKALTSQGRLSAIIMGSVPLFMFFILSLINESYLNALFETDIGAIMLLIAIMLDIFGTLFAFKLAQPTVSDF